MIDGNQSIDTIDCYLTMYNINRLPIQSNTSISLRTNKVTHFDIIAFISVKTSE